MHKLVAALLPTALAALAGAALASDGLESQAGDVLSAALPAATLVVELWRGEWTGAKQFAEATFVTVATTELLKHVTHVERPGGGDDRAFPSAHAAWAFSPATYVHRRYGLADAWPLYALATYVGYTRVHADEHTWADVAGAAGISALSSWWLVDPKQPAPAVAWDRHHVTIVWNVVLP
jgi:membrane-associated phospholipid phosphatase